MHKYIYEKNCGYVYIRPIIMHASNLKISRIMVALIASKIRRFEVAYHRTQNSTHAKWGPIEGPDLKPTVTILLSNVREVSMEPLNWAPMMPRG